MFGNGKGLFGGGVMPEQRQQMTPKGPQQGGIGGFLQRNQLPLAMAGDLLLRNGGGAGNPMAQMLMQQRQLEQMQGMRVQQGKQQQDAEQQQWLARQAYERANPEPRAPDAFDVALQRGGIDPNSPEGQQMYRDRAASMARDPNDQFVTVTIPGVGTYAGPQSGLPSFAGTAPERPVGRLTPVDGPTMQNTPRPQLNADGHPSVITRQQYEVLVRESSPTAVDAYLARRGIQVRN